MLRKSWLACALVACATAFQAPSSALHLRGTVAASDRCGPAVMMAKKEKKGVTVLLEKDTEGLGKAGELVEVKAAYAENFLVARGIGVIATPAMIEQAAADMATKAAAAAAVLKAAKGAQETITSKYGKAGLKYEVQVDKDGAPKESVTSVEVARELGRVGVTVTADDISMPEMTELGSVVAEVVLHPEVIAMLKVSVEKSKITIT